MKLGATPKQIAILVGLVLLALVLQFTGGDDRPPSDAQRQAKAPQKAPAASPAGPRTAAVTPTTARSGAPRQGGNRRSTQEFKPILRPRRVEDRVDPATIDPTLRTDLLARLANVPIQGGARPLFEFGTAPPPKAPDPGKIIPTKPVTVVKPVATPVVPSGPVTPVKPTAPPIPLKFYGFTAARGGAKRAFFLENEDVFVAGEGDLVKKRFKLVRINMNSVVMEDTEFKQQQTLPLTEISQ